MKKIAFLFTIFYSLIITSFFIPFLQIDLTDYEGNITLVMGYDNLYFFLNTAILFLVNLILIKIKSRMIFSLAIVFLSIIFLLDIIPLVTHPFTFGEYTLLVGFYLHYFANTVITYLIYRSFIKN